MGVDWELTAWVSSGKHGKLKRRVWKHHNTSTFLVAWSIGNPIIAGSHHWYMVWPSNFQQLRGSFMSNVERLELGLGFWPGGDEILLGGIMNACKY